MTEHTLSPKLAPTGLRELDSKGTALRVGSKLYDSFSISEKGFIKHFVKCSIKLYKLLCMTIYKVNLGGQITNLKKIIKMNLPCLIICKVIFSMSSIVYI